MAGRRTGKRTITVVTTTWTIRWWSGGTWVERSLGPRVEIVFGEAAGSQDEQAQSAVPPSQEPPGATVTDSQEHTKGA